MISNNAKGQMATKAIPPPEENVPQLPIKKEFLVYVKLNPNASGSIDWDPDNVSVHFWTKSGTQEIPPHRSTNNNTLHPQTLALSVKITRYIPGTPISDYVTVVENKGTIEINGIPVGY